MLSKKKFLLKESLSLVWKSGSGWAALNILISIIRSIVPLAVLFFIRQLIDVITSTVNAGYEGSAEKILWPVIAVVAAYFLNEVSEDTAAFVRKKQAFLLEEYMTGLLHRKSVSLDLAWFEKPGFYDKLSRASREAPWRPNSIVSNIVSLFRSTVSLIFISVLITELHWGFALLLLTVNIPGIWLRIHFSSILYNLHRDQTDDSRKAAYYNWILTGDRPSRELRLFGLGKYFRSLFEASFRNQKEEEIKITGKRTIVEIGTSLLKAAAVLFTLFFVSRSAIDGTISLGEMAMYLLAFRQGIIYIRDIFNSSTALYEDSLFISDVFEFLDLGVETGTSAHNLICKDLEKSIVVEKLTFTYPGSDTPVLKDLSFDIRKGETIALVGANGAGKSTLVRLLCGLYYPDNGTITWDGNDIKEIDPVEYRKMFSVIFQDFMLYNTSAGENIRLGDNDRKDWETGIKKAANEAGIDTLIKSLPKGYDTIIGHLFDDSHELSWGEWQKIALARALFRPSPLLILDEPVSALDAETEYELFNSFREITKDKTCILISHRLVNIKIADRIIVLNNGFIEECGTHAELIGKNGLYNKMFKMQTDRYNR